jgi:hypothetical protein
MPLRVVRIAIFGMRTEFYWGQNKKWESHIKKDLIQLCCKAQRCVKEAEGVWVLLLRHYLCTVRIKQITVDHNIINYSCSYMFRSYGVIIRLTFRTY